MLTAYTWIINISIIQQKCINIGTLSTNFVTYITETFVVYICLFVYTIKLCVRFD